MFARKTVLLQKKETKTKITKLLPRTGRTDRQTDRQSATQYAAPSYGGGPHKKQMCNMSGFGKCTLPYISFEYNIFTTCASWCAEFIGDKNGSMSTYLVLTRRSSKIIQYTETIILISLRSTFIVKSHSKVKISHRSRSKKRSWLRSYYSAMLCLSVVVVDWCPSVRHTRVLYPND